MEAGGGGSGQRGVLAQLKRTENELLLANVFDSNEKKLDRV